MHRGNKGKDAYVSPFVKQARAEAQKRAKEALRKLSRNNHQIGHIGSVSISDNGNNRNSGDWNHDTKGFALFDASIRKQEVFRLQPKVPVSRLDSNRLRRSNGSLSTELEDDTSFVSDIRSEDHVDRNDRPPSKLTVRSGAESRYSPSHRALNHQRSEAMPPSTSKQLVHHHQSPIHQSSNHHEHELMHSSPLGRRPANRVPSNELSNNQVVITSPHLSPMKGFTSHRMVDTGTSPRHTLEESDDVKDITSDTMQFAKHPLNTDVKITRATSPFDENIVALCLGDPISVRSGPENDFIADHDVPVHMDHPPLAVIDSIDTWGAHLAQTKHPGTVNSLPSSPSKSKVRSDYPLVPNYTSGNDAVMASTARILEAVGDMVKTMTNAQRHSRSKIPKADIARKSHRRDADDAVCHRSSTSAAQELKDLLVDHRIWPPDIPIRRSTSYNHQHVLSSDVVPRREESLMCDQVNNLPPPTSSSVKICEEPPSNYEDTTVFDEKMNPELTPSSLSLLILEHVQRMERVENEARQFLANRSRAFNGVPRTDQTTYTDGLSTDAVIGPGLETVTHETNRLPTDTFTMLPKSWHHLANDRNVTTNENSATVHHIGHATEGGYSSVGHYEEHVLTFGGAYSDTRDIDVEQHMRLQPPPRSATHETALTAGNLEKLNSVPTARVAVDTATHRVHDDALVAGALLGAQAPFPTSGRSKKVPGLVGDFPMLTTQPEFFYEMEEYQRKLKSAREMKDIAFRSRHLKMSEVADSITNELMDQLMEGLSSDLERFIDEYSEKFVDEV